MTTEQTRIIKFAMKSFASACTSTYVKRKLLEEGQGLTLAKALEIAENCEKVNTQLAAMSLEGQRLEEKEEDSASVNRIEEKKRVLYKSPATDVAESDISAETKSVQQEAISVINAGLKDIFKSAAKRSINVKQDQRTPSAIGTPRQVPQTW